MLKILLIDDHALLRRGLRRLLSQDFPRARLVEASDGRGALELLSASAFDLILLDLCLPGVGGIEVLKQIRRRWPETPVLAMSSCPESLFGDRCRRDGASGYLTKHLAPESMGKAVTRVLAGGTYFAPAKARPVGSSKVRAASGKALRMNMLGGIDRL